MTRLSYAAATDRATPSVEVATPSIASYTDAAVSSVVSSIVNTNTKDAAKYTDA
jgi:hypothetical protein